MEKEKTVNSIKEKIENMSEFIFPQTERERHQFFCRNRTILFGKNEYRWWKCLHCDSFDEDEIKALKKDASISENTIKLLKVE